MTDDGNLRAFAKVRLGAVIIHGVPDRSGAGQRAWIAFPQQPARRKADGSGAGWFRVVEITNQDLLPGCAMPCWSVAAKVARVEASRCRISKTRRSGSPQRPIRRPVRGTATRERTPAAPVAGEPVEPFYDDTDAAVRDLVHGPGR